MEDPVPLGVRSLRVLPAEIRDGHFQIEVLDLRDPGRGADNERPLTKVETLENLRRFEALPARARLVAGEVARGGGHRRRGGGDVKGRGVKAIN